MYIQCISFSVLGYLSAYLWNGYSKITGIMFPLNQFGQKVLNRRRVVNRVLNSIAKQPNSPVSKGMPQSIYISGCRGSGKTSLLMLLAEALTKEEYEVYFFKSANVSEANTQAVESLLQESNKNGSGQIKKIAILLDEVSPNTRSDIFVATLKGGYPNLVVIGAGLSRFYKSYYTAMFRDALRMNDIVLKENDEDFLDLIEHCNSLKVTTPKVTEIICKTILKRCGGHVFPTVAFIQHYFSDTEGKIHIKDEKDFIKHFDGPSLLQSDTYKEVVERCFDATHDEGVCKIVDRVLSGRAGASG